MTILGGMSILFVELYIETFPPKMGILSFFDASFISSMEFLKSPKQERGSPKFRQLTKPRGVILNSFNLLAVS